MTVGAIAMTTLTIVGALAYRDDEIGYMVAVGSGDGRRATPFWSITNWLDNPADAANGSRSVGDRFRASVERPFIWGGGRAPYANPPRPYTDWKFVTAGWPASWLWGWKRDVVVSREPPWEAYPWIQQSRGGVIELPLIRGGGTRPFPIKPYWPGLVINVALYSAIAFLLWSALGFVRRVDRRRRGLCAYCGYELTGMPKCPECGGSK
jgi:hypothetical protein